MKKIVRKIFLGKESGFSLLEVIVSISFLVVGLVGTLMLISQSISSGTFSSSKLIAANLAQEGTEVVRNIRDLNFDASGWDNWYASLNGSNDFIVQYDDMALRSFENKPLKYNLTSSLYNYDTGTEASVSYKRKITITKISDIELKVVCTVSWVQDRKSFGLVVEDRLWNWR